MAKEIYEKTKAKNFPKLMTHNKLQIQKYQRTPRKINTKEKQNKLPRYIGEGRKLKGQNSEYSQRKRDLTYREKQ